MLEADELFRRIKGHARMTALVAQLRAHANRVSSEDEPAPAECNTDAAA